MQVYSIVDSPLCLTGTAEVPLAGEAKGIRVRRAQHVEQHCNSISKRTQCGAVVYHFNAHRATGCPGFRLGRWHDELGLNPTRQQHTENSCWGTMGSAQI
jgi:hypothetical protein